MRHGIGSFALLTLAGASLLLTACDKTNTSPGSPLMSLGRTVLLLEDDCGAALTGATRITGLILGDGPTQAWPIQAAPDGSIQLDLIPGNYRVQALLRSGESSTEFNQTFTVGDDPESRTFNISLTPEELEEAWSLFRAKNYDGARAFLTELKSDPAFATNPAIDNALGWTAARQNNLGQATGFFNTAQGGGCTGVDALVGLAGVNLLSGNNPTEAASAERLLTEALDRAGEYASAPRHDDLTETDLYVARAFARWLQGNGASARTDLDLARPRIATEANDASRDLFNLLQLFLDN